MKKPNILYIMSDDHAANSISCYNSILAQVFRTPNLDRIANEGVRMDRYYATNAICAPARATIMTGQYGQINGVRTLNDTWDCNQGVNLAQLMKKAGYQTALFGKWHLGCEPGGFDDYKYLQTSTGNQQGTYQDPTFVEKGREDLVCHEGYVTDIITDMTVDFLKNRSTDKPFFVMCHHKAPHDFWEYPERHEHLFDGVEMPMPDTLFENRSHRSIATRDYGSSVTPRNKIRSLYEDFCKSDYVTGPLTGTENMTFEEKGQAAYQKYLKDYLRTVAGIDDSVGEILAELERQGELDNTVIMYTSDQGMFLGEHDYQDWSFEESLRAPLMVRYPAEIPAGSVSESLVANIDMAPLLLDYAGAEIPAEVQGKSCRNILKGQTSNEDRDLIYFRYWMHRANRHDNPAHYGIRTNDYKLTFYYGLPLDAAGAIEETSPAGWELYDMKHDPYETRNLYNDPAYADVIRDLKVRLEQAKIQYQDTDDKYPELMELKKNTR